jgi:hypothetical protein
MKRQWLAAVIAAIMSALMAAGHACAAPNWSALVPFKKVDADPNKDYLLTEEHGPWLIMCRSFAGPTAREEAHALVLELRKTYKLKAYVYQQTYDYTQRELGKGYNKYGEREVMKPANETRFDEIAVLVGNFDSAEDSKAQDVRDKIKSLRPKSLQVGPEQESSQRYWGLRLNAAKDDGKGPMRMAFVTRNPLLPAEFFAPKGLDALVKELNEGLEYSLLKNPGAYTVRIASFRGDTTTFNKDEIEKAERETLKKSKLEEGAEKAAKLTAALRAQGIEAYEFHDRHESIVTVGSFDAVGTGQINPDGREEINPAVLAVIERFKAKEVQVGRQKSFGPRKVAGVTLEIVPTPVAVPKESVGARYARQR